MNHSVMTATLFIETVNNVFSSCHPMNIFFVFHDHCESKMLVICLCLPWINSMVVSQKLNDNTKCPFLMGLQ